MNTPPTCPECGTPLPKESSHEVCPACLLAQGMRTDTGGLVETTTLPDLEEIAGKFPQFEILECLGRGGMGVVYKARQKSLNRIVAIKVIAPERKHDAHFAVRFSREAEILARLNHPQIVTIHDFGETDGLFFLVMEFVDGVNLREVLRDGRMEPAQALTIVPEICNALQYAHDQGIVHRDIKPENILLDRLGRVKVADFGIAKLAGVLSEPQPDGQSAAPNLTEAGKVMGTPAYMAPEQMASPENVDHRADIYALGAVFYQMLTGETPNTEAEPPSRKVSIDVRLDEIVLRALERNPSRRYQQVSEVRTKLETLTSAKKPKTNYVLWGCLWAAIAGFLLFILFVTSSFIWLKSAKKSQASATSAETGWRLWEERRLAEAEATFQETVKNEPKDANAWNDLGWTLFNSGKITKAVPAFEKAVALEPNQPGALNGLGQIALAQGDYGKAEEYLLRAAPAAPAAWFGLTRIYLLQAQFDKALPWAQKIADSGQGDDVAKRMLTAAKNQLLDADLRALIAPPPFPSSPATKLLALAWLDEIRANRAWTVDGEPVALSNLSLPSSLYTPPDPGFFQTTDEAKRPRFLSVWISQTEFDSFSVARVEVANRDETPLLPPVAYSTTMILPARPEEGKPGWLQAVLCAGTMNDTPARALIRLHFSAGEWYSHCSLPRDLEGTLALSGGAEVQKPEQDSNGLAFVRIIRNPLIDPGDTQWDVVAHLRGGKILDRSGFDTNQSGKLLTERFSFAASLNDILRFEIRRRPFSTMTWHSVPLRTESVRTLEIRADGSVVYGGDTWTSEQIKEKLKTWGRKNPQRPVVLRATPNCPYTQVTKILEACAAAKLSNVAFATNPP